MANIITCCRIIFSAVLLFIPVFSPAFYILYISAGLTDMLDGAAARITGTVSEFGSRLDTIADFSFAAVCLAKLLPVIDLPAWIWAWIGAIAVIKIINVISGFIVQKRFPAVHTVMNKITGLILFILPMTLNVIDLKYSSAAVCIIASFAAVQEGHIIRTGKKT
ncbi:MAG: CDP-alcohol phosphatidyltransferase family protein [Bacillota bacterium]|nr:CDP-alcohol phosphatidyltransferase family protein [Bacillota bacterium]